MSKWRAEQREKDKRLQDQEEVLRKKDLDTIEVVNRIKEQENLEKKARNKVLRDLCTQFNLNPSDVGKAIDDAKKELSNKGVEKKIEEE